MPEAEDGQDKQEQADNLKELRQAAKDGNAARAEAEAARRELAFVKAGVDTDSKLGKLLLKTYEGELTSEAIRTEALELGAIKETSTESETTASDEEQAQSRARRDLATESGAASQETEDPRVSAQKAFRAAMDGGDTRETAAGAAFAEMLKGAHRGDKRILL